MKVLKIAAVGGSLLLGFSLGLQQCKELPAKQEPYFLNLNDTVDYVGMETCKQCHSGHYNTFIHTGMGSSFGVATRERSKAKFNQPPVYDPKTDMYYAADWIADSLMLKEFRLRGKDTVHQRSVRISHIIGSGHHTNSHFWMENGYVYQAPLTFYTQSGKWDLPPGYEETNTRFSRKIDIECMSCHNAMPAVAEGSINKFTKIPNGIDCERCHGPGELHVKLKMKGIVVDTAKVADRSIVNPKRLPWALQIDVCQRCHLQGNNVLKPGKNFTDFRPGMPLSDVFDVFMPKKSEGQFFMAGHAERLQLSACFKGSNKSYIKAYNPNLNLTCITCHNPHVSVRETNKAKFNDACRSCHNPTSKKSTLHICSENENQRLKVSNNCVGCHMPSNNTGDIPHVTVHDHFIRKDYRLKPDHSDSQLAVFTLYAVNQAQPDKRTELEAYVSWFEKFEAKTEFLKKAKSLLVDNESQYPSLIHFYYTSGMWNEISNIAEKQENHSFDAWTLYRIAKAYDKQNVLSQAVDYYEKAYNKMPLNADFAAECGNALIRNGRFTDAIILLKKVAQQQPSAEFIQLNLGTAYFKANEIAKAKFHWQNTVKLNPDNIMAHENLAILFKMVHDLTAEEKEKAEIGRIHVKGAVSFH